ncbi:MAG: hypothetical protein ACYDB1_13140 [Acidiferrobacteraceae bacterium]
MRDEYWNPVEYVGQTSRKGYVVLLGEAGQFCCLADDIRTEDETETALVQGTRASDTDAIFIRLCNGALGHKKLTTGEIRDYAKVLGYTSADCDALAEYDYSGEG